jgi:hypothetical protein
LPSTSHALFAILAFHGSSAETLFAKSTVFSLFSADQELLGQAYSKSASNRFMQQRRQNTQL